MRTSWCCGDVGVGTFAYVLERVNVTCVALVVVVAVAVVVGVGVGGVGVEGDAQVVVGVVRWVGRVAWSVVEVVGADVGVGVAWIVPGLVGQIA